VAELKKHGFKEVSVFQVRGQGSKTSDVVFSPGLDEWTASSPQGDSVTFEVRDSEGGLALYQRLKSPDDDRPRYSDCPKMNAVKVVLAMLA
jgi:hypothetical protein